MKKLINMVHSSIELREKLWLTNAFFAIHDQGRYDEDASDEVNTSIQNRYDNRVIEYDNLVQSIDRLNGNTHH